MATKADVIDTQRDLFEGSSVKESVARGSCSKRVAEVSATIQRRGWAFLKVSGKSMFPWIREGDIVFLRRTRMLEVVRGDVVVFEKNGTLCVHRVLAVRGNVDQDGRNASLITKGDATEGADSPVSAGDFHGKVEFVYRRKKEIPIANGWRRTFGRVLGFVSPGIAWSKRLLLRSGGDSRRSESRPLPQIDGRRSAENSAD